MVVVGAGPAGASLAFLLADRGVEVTLLERQHDFAREFRGEVLLPSGIEAVEQLGLRHVLDRVPHARPLTLEAFLNRTRVVRVEADPGFFGGRLPTPVSQPALLEAIVAEAQKRPGFRFLRGAAAHDLLRDGGRVAGVRIHHDGHDGDLRADLVVGTDGRASAVRRRGGFQASPQDVPMDIVWCKAPPLDAIRGVRVYVGRGHLLFAYRTWDDRVQIAWVILKGTFGELHRRGIDAWVSEMAEHVSDDLAAHLRASVEELRHPFLLDCRADRVASWSAPGVLLLGDAAHTMSPVGGQGINVALRDVVVAANRLVPVLREDGSPEAIDAACGHVQGERDPEVRALQRLQAIPPRVLLQQAFWGEYARRLLALVLPTSVGRHLAAANARPFLFGFGEVRLRV